MAEKRLGSTGLYKNYVKKLSISFTCIGKYIIIIVSGSRKSSVFFGRFDNNTSANKTHIRCCSFGFVVTDCGDGAEITMKCFGMTNIGMKRQVNQDSFLIKEYDAGLLAVVCDGMGGASGGAEASATAATAFSGYADISFGASDRDENDTDAVNTEEGVRNVLLSAVRAANNAVFAASKEDEALNGMGTTLVSAFITDGRVYAVNVGDSRMYIIKENTITQVTHDHSYVQYLVDIGRMTADEAKASNNKNIITRAVGTEAEVETDFFTVDADMEGGYVLLCTDGLTNHLSEEEIAGCITEAEDPEAGCAMLIDRANRSGGSDNITAVIISM